MTRQTPIRFVSVPESGKQRTQIASAEGEAAAAR